MKIALIAPTTIPARRANTVQVMKMAQALTRLGHEVHVLSPNYPGQGIQEPATWKMLAEHYGLDSQNKFAFHLLPANPAWRRYDYSLRAVQWARKNRCDLVYTRLMQAAALSSLSGRPTILEVHDLPSGRTGPLILRSFLRGRGARRLVVITQALSRDLSSQLGAPPPGEASSGAFCIVAPDGVDLERYRMLPNPKEARRAIKRLSQDAERFTVGYTGHLYAGRGVDLILTLAERLEQFQFLLVGGEPADIERLEQEIQHRKIQNVVLTGFIPNQQLPLYQAACDVLLMPYGQKIAASSGGDIARYLSPMKLFEYMACERPILCSDLPVLREVLNNDNAVLIPPGEPDCWAAALESLRDSPEQRVKLAHQARIDSTRYTWEARAENILMNIDLQESNEKKPVT